MRLRTRPQSIKGWQEELSRLFARGHHCTLDLARAVHEARSTLAYGQWAQVWRSDRAPFPKRKGDMLALIGRRLGGLDEKTFSHLPRGWSVLYALAKLPAATLQAGIEDGRIHPALTWKEAKRLAKGDGQTSESPQTNVLRRLGRLRAFVHKTFPQWSSDEREQARVELARLLEHVTGDKVDSESPQSIDLVQSRLIQGVPFKTSTGLHAADVNTYSPATALDGNDAATLPNAIPQSV